MLMPGGFQKFAGIPLGISRIFECLMVQQMSANRRKNRSTQVQLEGLMNITKITGKIRRINDGHYKRKN